MTKKRFDCVAMKRAIQAKVARRLRRLSPAEEVAHFAAAPAGGDPKLAALFARTPRPTASPVRRPRARAQ